MNSIVVDGIPSAERESYGEPKPPTHARWRPPVEYPDVSVAVAVGQIIGLTIGAYLADGMDRARRALPEMPRVLLYAATLVVSAVYGLAEPFERRGERR